MTVNELKQAIIAAAKHVEQRYPASPPAARADYFVAHLAGGINAHDDLELARAVWSVYGREHALTHGLCTPSLMGRV